MKDIKSMKGVKLRLELSGNRPQDLVINHFGGKDTYFDIKVNDYNFSASRGQLNVFVGSTELGHGYKIPFLYEDDPKRLVNHQHDDIVAPTLSDVISNFLLYQKIYEDGWAPKPHHIFRVNFNGQKIYGFTIDNLGASNIGDEWGYDFSEMTFDDIKDEVRDEISKPFEDYLKRTGLLNEDMVFDDDSGSSFRVVGDEEYKTIDLDMNWLRKFDQMKIEQLKFEYQDLIQRLLEYL